MKIKNTEYIEIKGDICYVHGTNTQINTPSFASKWDTKLNTPNIQFSCSNLDNKKSQKVHSSYLYI